MLMSRSTCCLPHTKEQEKSFYAVVSQIHRFMQVFNVFENFG
jgi:hypothetical protein